MTPNELELSELEPWNEKILIENLSTFCREGKTRFSVRVLPIWGNLKFPSYFGTVSVPSFLTNYVVL